MIDSIKKDNTGDVKEKKILRSSDNALGVNVQPDYNCPKHGNVKKDIMVLRHGSEKGEDVKYIDYCARCYVEFMDKNVSRVIEKMKGEKDVNP